MQTTAASTLLVVGGLCLLAGLALGYALALARRVDTFDRDRTRTEAALERRAHDQAADAAVVKEGLERLHDQLRDLEQTRVSWQGQLHQQVSDMRASSETLRRETHALSTALRRPQVRGRWGELHLRRAVELAGMVEHCDFVEQARLDDGRQRPDLVVRLAGGRSVVVDAKVPLDAHLDAGASDDEAARATHLERHARQLRTHVDHLASKAYWRAVDETPEFVVLFVPAESFLAAALEVDRHLLEHAATRQVVLASPTTLIALLRTVAHGWRHEALTEQTARIHVLGRELHARLGTFGGHLDRIGRSLNQAVEHYNRATGSYDSRVLVAARRFVDLDVVDDQVAPPRAVELRAVPRRADPDGADRDRRLGT